MSEELIEKITRARRTKNPKAQRVKSTVTPRTKRAPEPDPIAAMSRDEKLHELNKIRAELGIEGQHHADTEVLEAEEIDLTHQYNIEAEETAEDTHE